jgi:hypothetical protein
MLEDNDPFSDPPEVIVETDGTRTVRRADDLIQVHIPNQRRLFPDTIAEDGTVTLDSAGEFRYRPSGERWPTLRPGFTAYERIRT